MLDIIYRFDPSRPSSDPEPADAAGAWHRLEVGNTAFTRLLTDAREGPHIVYFDPEDIGFAATGSVPRQEPFAVVLSCSDARVPTEMIFDCACNDLFVVRVAGNTLGQDQLGSIDYAVENLGRHLKLLVVLGHSQCGAVTAAVDAFIKPGEYLGLSSSHHVRAIVNSLFPPVRGAAMVLAGVWGEEVVHRPGYRAALIETAVVFNAALTASILRDEYGDPAADRRIVFGVYDLASRQVHVPLPDKDDGPSSTRLMEAPANREEFRHFAEQVGTSPFIRGMLGP